VGWRLVTLVLAACALVAAPARAAEPVVLGKGPGGLLALGAQDGTAFAVLGTKDAARPFAVVRSSGKGAGAPRAFGQPGAEVPDIAGSVLAWQREISSGLTYSVDTGAAPPVARGIGSGPPQIAQDAGTTVLAYPDLVGDVTLQVGTAPPVTLTADAPEHRHLPLDVASENGRPLVLDLDQRRTDATLRVLGDGAPTAPVLATGREDLQGTLAIEGDHVYVAYRHAGRAYLADADRRPDARWTTRKLSGEGPGAPAVGRAGGHTFVAFARGESIYLDGERLGPGGRPQMVPDGRGGVFVGWTRDADTAMLVRAG
jgi:hypothetical protein